MHRRSLLIGIGIGIIIGVLLLELFTIGEKAKSSSMRLNNRLTAGMLHQLQHLHRLMRKHLLLSKKMRRRQKHQHQQKNLKLRLTN